MIDTEHGEPVIMDFGLARCAEVGEASLSQHGMVLGTPTHMSPEQARGAVDEIGPASDIYSLGVILYQLLCGDVPFRGHMPEVMAQVLKDDPAPPSERRNGIDDRLERICLKMLAKQPHDRYASMEAVSRALADFQQPASPGPRSPQPSGPSLRAGHVASAALRRRPMAVTAAGVFMTALIAAVVFLLQTKYGTLRIEVNDENLMVKVDGETISFENRAFTDKKAEGSYRLAVLLGDIRLPLDRPVIETGGRQLIVRVNGKRISSDRFEISHRGETVIRIALRRGVERPDNGADPAGLRVDAAPRQAGNALHAGAPPLAVAPFDAQQAARHQEAWARHLGVPVERVVELPGGEALKMVLIPPGEFLIGSTPEEQASCLAAMQAASDPWAALAASEVHYEGPQHRVRITKPFWMSRYEFTRGQFRRFVEETGFQTEAEQDGKGGFALRGERWIQRPEFVWKTPGLSQTDDDPVIHVSWNDTRRLCDWLSRQHTDMEFSLPTEAQWEYACRAGTTSFWYCGNDEASLNEHAWFHANSGNHTHPVGQLRPNAFGLYDMHGNVLEWCADWHAPKYATQSLQVDPTGPTSGERRVFRGGSWNSRYGFGFRSARRSRSRPTYRSDGVGFRVVAEIPRPVTSKNAAAPRDNDSAFCGRPPRALPLPETTFPPLPMFRTSRASDSQRAAARQNCFTRGSIRLGDAPAAVRCFQALPV